MNKNMQKTLIALAVALSNGVAYSAATTSAVVLPDAGVVKPADTLAISLDSLLKKVQYNVTCQITNTHAELVDMRFEVETGTGGGYGAFSLNETMLENNQGTLKNGENTLGVMIASSGPGATLIFKNLDFNHSVQVNQCIARPDVKKTAGSGYFFAYNDTDRMVEIQVGDVFYKNYSYTIYPGSWRYIYVSTDNQNIHISRVW